MKSNIECKSYVLELGTLLNEFWNFVKSTKYEWSSIFREAICKFLHLWKISSNQFYNKIYENRKILLTRTLWKNENYSHRKNISSNQLFSNLVKKVVFTKFLPKKSVRENFRNFHRYGNFGHSVILFCAFFNTCKACTSLGECQ